jgi:putative chitinase
MEITLQQLVAIAPNSAHHAPAYVGPLNACLAKAEINTPRRMACFIAQVMHESGSLVYSHELASGAAYDTGRLAAQLGNTPEADGDGQKYKGRGPIEITGHDNYLAFSQAYYGDDRAIEHPELLEDPVVGCAASAWFWHTHGCNALADADDQRALCHRINGGLNGFTERQALTVIAKEVFGVAP